MQIILITKSELTTLGTLYDQNPILDYKMTSFSDCIRQEVTNGEEFGKYLKNQLNLNKGILSSNDQTRVWERMFERNNNNHGKVLILLETNFENYQLLRNVINVNHSNNEGKIKILNLYLEKGIIEQRAQQLSKKHQSKESISTEEFIKKKIDREAIRLEFLNTLKKTEGNLIIDIEMNGEQKLIETQILNEINEL